MGEFEPATFTPKRHDLTRLATSSTPIDIIGVDSYFRIRANNMVKTTGHDTALAKTPLECLADEVQSNANIINGCHFVYF